MKNLSFSKLSNENRIRGLKVTVIVGDCDSPLFINESCEYAQVYLNKFCIKYITTLLCMLYICYIHDETAVKLLICIHNYIVNYN